MRQQLAVVKILVVASRDTPFRPGVQHSGGRRGAACFEAEVRQRAELDLQLRETLLELVAPPTLHANEVVHRGMSKEMILDYIKMLKNITCLTPRMETVVKKTRRILQDAYKRMSGETTTTLSDVAYQHF